MRLRISLLALCSLFLLSELAQAKPAQVLLIRHGEKPEGEEGRELSERGWERARALPKLFQRAEFSQHGAPVALVGMAPKKKKKGSIRALQTLKYVAEEMHLAVNSAYTDEDVSEMVSHVNETAAYDGKFVVICWNHDSMKEIAKAFGVKKAPKMPGESYDRAWLITPQEHGPSLLQDLPEKLLAGDSEQ